MAKKIRWTKTASKNLAGIVNYLIENWPDQVVSDFLHNINETLFLISHNPEVGILQVKERGIRGLLVSKQNKLFYRVDAQRIIVLKIFDTRQNPKRLKFRKGFNL